MSKVETKTYLFHEISSYLPLLEGEEFDALVEDIKQFGQIEPAVLYEGKLIDGRNRYRACKQLDLELQVREWNPSEFTGMTPLQFVISENIMRRHLNTAQKSEVGLLLLEEEEKLAKKRQKEIAIERMKDVKRDEKGRIEESPVVKDSSQLSEGKSRDIVGTKVKVSGATLGQAKKIKEIAKGYTDKEGIEYPPEPVIAEEWEKAMRGEQGVESVYQKAKVVEEAKELPNGERKKIIKEIEKGEIAPKKLREIVKEKKETQERLKIAEEKVKLRKQVEEMEKLYKKIENHKDKIKNFENAMKKSEATLNALSKDITKRYSQWKDESPERILTELGVLYETLDTKNYDNQLKDLKIEYDKLMGPLREKLKKLEAEYTEKKKKITQQKTEKINEIDWVEKQQDLLVNEFEKTDFQKGNIEKAKEELDSMLKEYEEKYK